MRALDLEALMGHLSIETFYTRGLIEDQSRLIRDVFFIFPVFGALKSNFKKLIPLKFGGMPYKAGEIPIKYTLPFTELKMHSFLRRILQSLLRKLM